jgi:hypothetical protein
VWGIYPGYYKMVEDMICRTRINIVIQIEYLPYSRLEYFLYNPTPLEYIRRGRGPLVEIQIQIMGLA